MARNKHPEETVQRILTTASKLFLEKGYEKTSLQDIIRETGLSQRGDLSPLLLKRGDF